MFISFLILQINFEKLCHSLEDQLSDFKTKHDENVHLINEINTQKAKLQNENGYQQKQILLKTIVKAAVLAHTVSLFDR